MAIAMPHQCSSVIAMPHHCSPAPSVGPEQNRALPMKALLDRLGSGVNVLPWSAYLPEELQPPELRAARAAAAASKASSSLAIPHRGEIVDASSEGCQAFCLDEMQLAGRVWSLSQEAHGCRQVQQALEGAASDDFRQTLASELRGHVLEACKCPHANHVLQKLILLLPASASQFIIDEMIAGTTAQMVRHKYGCRIIQRLVEHCHTSQVRPLVDSVLTDILALSRHPYGTFVVQNILQHGTDDDQRRILKAVMKGIRVLGSEPYGCAVVSAALTHGLDDDRHLLAQLLLREPGLLVFLASSRHGHTAVLRALDLLAGDEQDDARSRLQAEAVSLRHSRYGRLVVDYMETSGPNQLLLSAAIRAGA